MEEPFGSTNTTVAESPDAIDRSSLGVRIALIGALVVWMGFGGILLLWLERPSAGPSDPIAHAVLFTGTTVTALAVASAWRLSLGWKVLLVAMLAALAPLSELLQAVVAEQRSAQVGDMFADLLVVGVGIAIFEVARRLLHDRMGWTVALTSFLVVTLLAGFTATVSVRESVWWRCRSHDRPPIERAVLDVEWGPMLEFDGAREIWRWSGGEASGEAAAPQAAASAVWCEAIRSNEFTVMAVIDVSGLKGTEPWIFLSSQLEEEEMANVELGVRGDDLLVRFRAGAGDRVPNLTLRNALRAFDRHTIAVRLTNERLTVTLNDQPAMSAQLSMEMTSWFEHASLAVGHGGSKEQGSVEYLAVFAGRSNGAARR
jgi:hypothetical protein